MNNNYENVVNKYFILNRKYLIFGQKKFKLENMIINIFRFKNKYYIIKMSITCEFCFKIFKNDSILNKHKLTAKYCLNIQTLNYSTNLVEKSNTVANEITIVKQFKCEKCDKILNSKQSFNLHIKSCKEILKFQLSEKDLEILLIKKDYEKKLSDKDSEILLIKKKYEKQITLNINYKNDIEKNQEKYMSEITKYHYNLEHKDELIDEYKKQIVDLQDRLERLHVKAIEKPTITNNNKIDLKCFNLSQETINDKIFSKFNDNYMYNGMSGLAQFVKDHVITLEDGSIVYACFDKARKIFKYKDKDGNVIKDPKALKLIALIQPALKEQSQILLDYFVNEYDNVNKEDSCEINKVNTQKELALRIGMEISTMHENQKFSNELSNITS